MKWRNMTTLPDAPSVYLTTRVGAGGAAVECLMYTSVGPYGPRWWRLNGDRERSSAEIKDVVAWMEMPKPATERQPDISTNYFSKLPSFTKEEMMLGKNLPPGGEAQLAAWRIQRRALATINPAAVTPDQAIHLNARIAELTRMLLDFES